MKKHITAMILGLMVAGCTQPDANSEQKEPPRDPNRTVCTDPRPQMCTREYNPVCARLTNGKDKTYATGCTACSDIKVVSYTLGACSDLAH